MHIHIPTHHPHHALTHTHPSKALTYNGQLFFKNNTPQSIEHHTSQPIEHHTSQPMHIEEDPPATQPLAIEYKLNVCTICTTPKQLSDYKKLGETCYKVSFCFPSKCKRF